MTTSPKLSTTLLSSETYSEDAVAAVSVAAGSVLSDLAPKAEVASKASSTKESNYVLIVFSFCFLFIS